MPDSFTTTSTFTRTHAKQLAAKVIADLYQCSIHYDRPSLGSIAAYQTELMELLTFEYVERYEFGFKKNGKRLLSFRYRVGPDGAMHGDADAGSIYAKAVLDGAAYYNYLTQSQKWWNLTEKQRDDFETRLPFQRTSGSLPHDGDGCWRTDHGYSAGGIRVSRETFRPR